MLALIDSAPARIAIGATTPGPAAMVAAKALMLAHGFSIRERIVAGGLA